MVELADTWDLKSPDRNIVPVQVRLPAPFLWEIPYNGISQNYFLIKNNFTNIYVMHKYYCIRSSRCINIFVWRLAVGNAYITNSCRRGVNGRAELQIPVCVFEARPQLQSTNYWDIPYRPPFGIHYVLLRGLLRHGCMRRRAAYFFLILRSDINGL